jgi:hypothetical protein
MFAVIHASSTQPRTGMFPVAGRPLVTRQLQWLRAFACDQVAIGVGRDRAGDELFRWLTELDALGTNVVLVRTEHAGDARAIAAAAGFPDDAAILALPGDVLPFGDPRSLVAGAGGHSLLASVPPPAALAGRIRGGGLRVLAPRASTTRSVAWAGRAVTLASLGDALALSNAALAGALPPLSEGRPTPMLIHAAERSKGVWIARDALVEPGAQLQAPVLIGAGAVVRAGAQVGPGVCVGDRAVIESGAVVRESLVEAGTIVGERLWLEQVLVEPHAVVDLATGARQRVDDPLQLTSRDRPRTNRRALASLALATLVGGVLWTLLAQAAPAAPPRAGTSLTAVR